MNFTFYTFLHLPYFDLEQCLRFLFLGLIQGITEFLPISSTAHLKVVSVAFGWGDPGSSVSAFIQLGSAFAVISYFWSDLKKVFKGSIKVMFEGEVLNPKRILSSSIILGTIPILIAGALLKVFWFDYDDSFFRSIPTIALISIFMGLLLGFAEQKGSRTKSFKDLTLFDAIKIGLAQAFALIPGVSRSGITITAALLNGWERASATRFCFLLGIPAITLGALAQLKSAFISDYSAGFLPLIIGVFSATISSWVSIHFMIRFLKTNTTNIFVLYRIIFGFMVLGWWYFFPHT